MKVIQPMTWAGQQKGGPDSPMVCGACPDWRACEAADRCSRAKDSDYARGLGTAPAQDPWRICVDTLRERWVGEELPETIVGWMFEALDAAGDATVPRDDRAREEARIMAAMVFADIGPECDYGAVVSNVIRACEAAAKTGNEACDG